MNKPLILIQPTIEDKFNTTTNKNDNFSIGIIEAELDELLVDNKNFINNIINEAKENNTSLLTKEITQHVLKFLNAK